jgi:hypothetical protein
MVLKVLLGWRNQLDCNELETEEYQPYLTLGSIVDCSLPALFKARDDWAYEPTLTGGLMNCTRILLAPHATAGLLGTYLNPIRFNSNESAASVRFTS